MGFDYKNLSGIHCRAARALVNWHQDDLVRESGVSKRTIHNFENDQNITDRVKRDLCEAFERAGVEFMNGEAPGARLHKSKT